MEGNALGSPIDEAAERLHADVEALSGLLAEVLVESGGAELLHDVERLREAATAFRDDPSPDRARTVESLVADLDLDHAAVVARAFTVQFHLTNLAEERHRVRVLRARGRRPGAVAEGIAEAVEQVRRADGEDALARLLEELSVTPVLTAHPTEARRRAIVDCLRRIAALLDRSEDPRAPWPERRQVAQRLREEITELWRTDHVRTRRPGPLDEVRTAMAVFDATLFELTPRIQRDLDHAVHRDASGTRPAVRGFLRWGSWVGGDRDGNPSVTAEVTRAAARIHADHVLRGLEAATRRVAATLTASTRFTPATPELLDSLERDAERFPEAAAALAARAPEQPHRRKLALVAERLRSTRRREAGGYADASGYVDDLRSVQRSLVAAGAPRLAFGRLQDLVWQAEAFGFHLASLEVRQHAQVHDRVLEELAPGTAGDARALDRLAREGWPGKVTARTREAVEALETFRAIADIQRELGTEACRRYVVSFTRSAADVLGVQALAQLAVPGIELDVVPLLESQAELAAPAAILDDLIELPSWRAWLESRERRVEVMLGYSDSAKEVGFLAANVALFRAEAALATWARRHGARLTIFHGRGGALGRGGGPTNRAILSQPPGSIGARFKVTEQGEVVMARYADPDIARRHLEQVTNAVILASSPTGERPASRDRFGPLLDRLAAASAEAYRTLVQLPGFVEFFSRITPLREIEDLQVGSRPARRTAGRDLGSLRAIPWVFAWTQSRVNLPGWFGLGSALELAARRSDGASELRAMHEEHPFFRSLIETAELALVKADLPIARRYLELGGRPDLTRAITDEFERTLEQVLAVTGNTTLLEDRPVLRETVRLRNPWVDALSFLQLRYLTELRAGTLAPDEVRRARRHVLMTVNGIAAGLQDTG